VPPLRIDLGGHDVILVGGRPAGAALAARLGMAGLRVLVLERATFPSPPAVSAPFVLPHALAELDELGVDEAEYAASTPALRHFVLEMSTYFRARFRFFEPVAGRTHFYAIDRARLDHALWRNLARFETVTAVEGVAVVDLLVEDGVVRGVRARLPGHDGVATLRAGCVVGADGRYSLVARKAGAAVTHQRRDRDTTLYFADWEGLAAYDDPEPLAHIHTSCDGFSFVIMPTADERVMVVAQGRADRYAELPGSPQAAYHALLRARPLVWRRLAGARQVSELRGIKRIGNLFRQSHGPGWALVGDAYHQKDSLDAQGIYDALLGARLLADALVRWHEGCPWSEALAAYARAAEAALRPMFDATMDRVGREIYGAPPAVAAKTVMRWILTHERYGRRFADVLTRRVDPAALFVPSVLLPAMAGGAWGRLRARLGGQPDPTDALVPTTVP
jgi:flavin-dependent dehydrogenase